MRNPKRIDRIINLARELWHTYPDWRLGQLISNVIGDDNFIFYMEDDEFEEKLLELKKKLKENK